MIHVLTTRYEVLDPLFGCGARPIELDMGCGKGGFTLGLAERYPERLVLGNDVMLGRLRRIARKADRRGLENLELLRVDSLALVDHFLPPACIDRVHLLCPDPWPKGRHRHFRLVTTEFLARVSRILVPGGILHLSTDHLPYFSVWGRILADFGCFTEDASGMADVCDLLTDFEKLWLAEGRSVPHICFRFSG